MLVIHNFCKNFILGTLIISFFSIIIVSVPAQAESFNPSVVLKTNDLYSLPSKFGSTQKIQEFLVSTGSVLATTNVTISLHKNGSNYPLNQSVNYVPSATYLAQEGQVVSAAEFIWRISRTSLGAGCSTEYSQVCFDNGAKPINPGFVLAKIQKESGLINGACSKPDADTNPSCFYSTLAASNPERYSLQGRLERATGYYCFETLDRTKGCYDENPNWVIYKGVFRQVYHMVRRIRILERSCDLGSIYSFKNAAGDFTTGNTVTIDGQPVYLGNGITCALYIYTPHISDLLWRVMNGYGILYDYRDEYNLPDDYQPSPISIEGPSNNLPEGPYPVFTPSLETNKSGSSKTQEFDSGLEKPIQSEVVDE
jgi:hypothetical protein